MTPFELGIMLHYYGSCEEHPYAHAPIWPQTIGMFKMQGLLRDAADSERQYGATVKVTEKGIAFVESLMRVGLPVQKWLAPDELARLHPRRFGDD